MVKHTHKMSLHLFDRAVGDGESQLFFSDSEGEPQFSPGSESSLASERALAEMIVG